MSAIGCEYFAEALKINKSLEKFHLYNNHKITDRGCQFLTDSMENNNTLIELYLPDSISYD